MASQKRVAIVTGAAEGIGRAVAARLAQDGMDLGLFDLPRAQGRLEELAETLKTEHGARVVVTDANGRAITKKTYGEAFGFERSASGASTSFASAGARPALDAASRAFTICSSCGVVYGWKLMRTMPAREWL